MAIAYGHMTVITRSNGGNAVRFAAYQARQNIVCARTGEGFDYREQAYDHSHHEILLPPGAPAEFNDAAVLWNSAQAMERRKDSQEAKSLILALPRELDTAAQIDLARSFAIEHFIARGLPVQIDVHDKSAGNPYAWLLIATRQINQNGFSDHKARDLNPKMYGRRVINNQDWSGQWTAHQNAYFEKHDLDIRVDPIAAVSQRHLGRRARMTDGEHPEIASVRKINAALCRDPEYVLGALTRHSAVFTMRDIERYIEKHADPKDDVAVLKARVMTHPDLVCLDDDENSDLAQRFTTTMTTNSQSQSRQQSLIE